MRCAEVLQVIFIPNFNVSQGDHHPLPDISCTSAPRGWRRAHWKQEIRHERRPGHQDGANTRSRARWARRISSVSARTRTRWGRRSAMSVASPRRRAARCIRPFGPARSAIRRIPTSHGRVGTLEDYYLIGHDFSSYLDALMRGRGVRRSDVVGRRPSRRRRACGRFPPIAPSRSTPTTFGG